MSPKLDSVALGQVCWNVTARPEVMNTIALDVPESIFRATHSASFVQQQGQKSGVLVRTQERAFLDDFLSPSHSHVFDIAVGDSGTGKSHFIKWMYLETLRRVRTEGAPYRLVLIPRSSTNLADVVRRVIEGFSGEVATRLREELKKQHALSQGEAKNRVLDELAYVLDGAPTPEEIAGLSPEEEQIRRDLPALVRDHKMRLVLFERRDGIVARVSDHVLGKRKDSSEAVLRWSPEDLHFSVVETQGAGNVAKELALLLREDDALRENTASFLNAAQPQALRQLLRFRSGDMKAALEEVRQELLGQGKELVLFIEDLSITEGLDAELIEALQVRTRDAGKELCRLRSIVGVTKDDYARMRENIAEGRTLRTVFFDMPVASSREVGVTKEEVADFASRYLNAARYSLKELESWSASNHQGDLASACAECPAVSSCHDAFGAVGGRGLFPFTQEALSRLYDQVATPRSGSDRAFNPRLLVGRVLDQVLDDAEQSLPRHTFPRAVLLEAFGLKNVKAVVEVGLRRFGTEAGRMLRAIDLYSPDPTANQPTLSRDLTRALELPDLVWSPGKGSEAGGGGAPGETPPVTPPAGNVPAAGRAGASGPPMPVAGGLDVFDRWLREEPLSDADLNRWRVQGHAAISAYIDWDAEGLGFARTRFKTVSIRFEGQFTKAARTDVSLEIKRTPEVAIVLRVLTEAGSSADSSQRDQQLVMVRAQLSAWAGEVLQQLRSFLAEPGDPNPTHLAARVLGVGALISGEVAPESPAQDALAGALKPWTAAQPEHATPSWASLWEAYAKHHSTIREELVERLACSKGGRAGGIIDPAPVLDVIREATIDGKVGNVPPESEAWRLSKSVAALAKDVSLRLDTALAEERAKWGSVREDISRGVGGNDVKATVKALREAVTTAAGVGMLQAGGTQNFMGRLEELSAANSNLRLRDLERLAEAEGPLAVYLLGKIDRVFIHNLHALLADARTVCEASIEAGNERKHELGRDADPDAVEAEVLSMVAEIDATLQGLAEQEQ